MNGPGEWLRSRRVSLWKKCLRTPRHRCLTFEWVRGRSRLPLGTARSTPQTPSARILSLFYYIPYRLPSLFQIISRLTIVSRSPLFDEWGTPLETSGFQRVCSTSTSTMSIWFRNLVVYFFRAPRLRNHLEYLLGSKAYGKSSNTASSRDRLEWIWKSGQPESIFDRMCQHFTSFRVLLGSMRYLKNPGWRRDIYQLNLNSSYRGGNIGTYPSM